METTVTVDLFSDVMGTGRLVGAQTLERMRRFLKAGGAVGRIRP